jgi:lysophospholipase L1-like esterase
MSATHGSLRAGYYRVLVALLTLAACEALVIGWLWTRPRDRPPVLVQQQGNPIRRLFPNVDFRKVYPGLSLDEIDALQREGIAVRFRYAPFVQFEPVPVSGRFIQVTAAGYRSGREAQPWPPREGDLVFFVFGGSTTFGYGLPDAQTVVSALQEEMGRRYPGRRVECYNFGRGYYASTQERLLFESLLLQGLRPDAAIFVDGLNDYHFWDGRPWLTPELEAYMTPDLPVAAAAAPPATEEARASAVEQLLDQYARNARMIEAVAREHGISLALVGQPVPFYDFPRSPQTDLFNAVFAGHELCAWGYPRFRERAAAARFGDRFVWCGDAFARATTYMYVDSIHYSAAGARLLAATIAERAAERHLLPGGSAGAVPPTD